MADTYETLPNGRIKVPLPGGQHAVMRTVPTLTAGDLRRVYRTADEDGVDIRGTVGLAAMQSITQAAILHVTSSWTLTGPGGEPLPIAGAAFEDLPLDTYDALADAVQPVVQRVLRDNTAVDPKSGPPS